jgi:hypothetical protein
LPTIAVDRVLLQATVSDGGHQTCRARFLIARLSARFFDVEMPAPPASLNLELLLDGKRISTLQTVDEEGNDAENGRIARIQVEPELYKKPVVLDLRYQLPPGRTEGSGRMQTTFYPPRLRGNVFPGRVRWQVALPAEWVPVVLGGGVTLEQRWGFRGWLPAPRAAVSTVDLERWFLASSEPRPAGELKAEPGTRSSELGTRNSEVVCWQANLAPLVVPHVAEPIWLLGSSLAVLVVGLILYFSTSLPRLLGTLIVLLGGTVVAAAIFWPSLLPVIAYGAEPGIAVLLLVSGFLWWRQRRYQRQLVFMPGFSRLSGGSSVLRAGSSHRAVHEPSTVDAHQLVPVATDPAGSRQEPAPRKP